MWTERHSSGTHDLAFSDAVTKRNHVNVVGEGDQTIVFAHGFGTDQHAWDGQVDALKDSYRCVLFDLAGSGRSDLSGFSKKRYATLYSYARDLLEICSTPGMGKVRLVAHSVSAMTGMLASILDPDLFSGLMIIGASPRYLNDAEAGYFGGFDAGQLDALFDAMSANYHGWASGFAPVVVGNPERPELARYFAEYLLAIRPDVAQAVLRVIFNSDHRAELPRVPVPVCVVQSSGDPAVPDCVGEYLVRNLARGQLLSLKATGHLPHVSSPELVTGAIQDWMAGSPS